MFNEAHQFEELLAYHCAPALKKLKCANMFHIEQEKFAQLDSLIETYNTMFNPKGIYFRVFQKERKRITVYVYDPEKIQALLQNRDIRLFLKSLDYPTSDLEKSFQHLEYRMNYANSYPHEIGIFLGYPLEDVLGFMSHKPCLCLQDWKVYSNLEQAKRLFAIFDQTRRQFIDAFESGKQIGQLI